MKKCSRCGIVKDESEFHIRKASKDGLTASCKVCLSEYDKLRANNPNRVAARLAYSKTEAGIASGNKAKKKWIASNPNKRKAQQMVNNAIRDGKLFKEPCCVCGATKNIHAHHDDYLKPLNIRWMCARCHHRWHSLHGEGLNPF